MRYTAVNIATDQPVPLDQVQQGLKYMYYPRIRCKDCPGKMYTPGPERGVGNFTVHVKNRLHREKVEDRLRRSRLQDSRDYQSSVGIDKPKALRDSASQDSAVHVSRFRPSSVSTSSDTQSDDEPDDNWESREVQDLENAMAVSRSASPRSAQHQVQLVSPTDDETSEVESNGAEVPGDVVKLPSKIDTDRRFSCTWTNEGTSCGRSFARLDKLKDHYSNVGTPSMTSIDETVLIS